MGAMYLLDRSERDGRGATTLLFERLAGVGVAVGSGGGVEVAKSSGAMYLLRGIGRAVGAGAGVGVDVGVDVVAR